MVINVYCMMIVVTVAMGLWLIKQMIPVVAHIIYICILDMVQNGYGSLWLKQKLRFTLFLEFCY